MLTRNNIIWVVGFLGGGLSFVAAHFGAFPFIRPEYQGAIELLAAFISGGSAALRQSPLPHSASSDQRIDLTRVIGDPPRPMTPGTFGR